MSIDDFTLNILKEKYENEFFDSTLSAYNSFFEWLQNEKKYDYISALKKIIEKHSIEDPIKKEESNIAKNSQDNYSKENDDFTDLANKLIDNINK